ncbi:MAG: hypothetical protein WBD55_06570 [Dehalococcoidia bacterium]
MATVLIHLKNPITITLSDGSDFATECIRRDSDGSFAVRVDLFSDTGEWLPIPDHSLLGVPRSEIANVEQFGDDPPPPPLTWGESQERRTEV